MKSFLRKACFDGLKQRMYRYGFYKVPCQGRRRFARQRSEIAALSLDAYRSYVYNAMLQIVNYVYHNNEFYRNFYAEHQFTPRQLHTFDDIQRIPVVRKQDLKKNVHAWSRPGKGAVLANTGGTSGTPLSFYLPHVFEAKENLYQQMMWRRLGWAPDSVKLIFQGVVLGERSLRYSIKRGGFFVNAYKPFHAMTDDIVRECDAFNVSHLHGYPSSIYQFARACEKNADLAAAVKKHLTGIYLCSEYPAKVYRDVIKRVFCVPTLSWYGHSEMVVLAEEQQDEQGVYSPLRGYGYHEAVLLDDGRRHLVGTSFDNYVSPFIRYDTGDSITPMESPNGILSSFSINDGRMGEFVLDKQHLPVSLTSLIFGRHHSVFNVADFVQVRQSVPGQVVLCVAVQDQSRFQSEHMEAWFDLDGVDMDFEIRLSSSPQKTESGKVPLLIRE